MPVFYVELLGNRALLLSLLMAPCRFSYVRFAAVNTAADRYVSRLPLHTVLDCSHHFSKMTFTIGHLPNLGHSLSTNGRHVWKGEERKLMVGPTYSLWYTLSDYLGFDMRMRIAVPNKKVNGSLVGQLTDVTSGSLDFAIMVAVSGHSEIFRLENGRRVFPYVSTKKMNELSLGFNIVCPQPQRLPAAYNLILPLDELSWAAVLVSLVACFLAFLAINTAYNRVPGLPPSEPSPVVNFLFTFKTFFAEEFNGPWLNFGAARKLLILFWQVTTMLVVFIYLCNLRSYLISSDYEDPIDSLDELMQTGKRLLTTRLTTFFHDRQYKREARELEAAGRLVTLKGGVAPHALAFVKEGGCALMPDILSINQIAKFQKKFGRAYYHIGKKPLIFNDLGVVYAKRNRFAPAIVERMLRLDASGVNNQIIKRYFSRSKILPPSSKIEPLELQHFILTLSGNLACLGIAAIVFGVEFLKNKQMKTPPAPTLTHTVWNKEIKEANC